MIAVLVLTSDRRLMRQFTNSAATRVLGATAAAAVLILNGVFCTRRWRRFEAVDFDRNEKDPLMLSLHHRKLALASSSQVAASRADAAGRRDA